MYKIKINNQIVIMRKFVKQAKVHNINRLVKQMKLLQNRKGDEAKVEKCKRKAERFWEEIVLLKSIKPDDVSKSALCKARDWKEILQQKTSTLDERCLAMLASYEAVQKEVVSFHSSNPNLVTRIPSLLKKWEEKSKLPKGSPFHKQKKILERNNSWKKSNISSNALSKEVLPSSVKKFKVGVHDDLNELEGDNDVMQHDMSIENKEHESESLKGNKNQSKFNELDKSSDEEVCIDDENSANNTDLEEADSDTNILESASSESIDQNSTANISKFNDNNQEQHKSDDDDEGSDFFLRIGRGKKLSENKNFSANERASENKYEKILLDKPLTSKHIPSNQSVYSYKNIKENNFKTITMLNLHDLQMLNEIPVEKKTEHEKNSNKDEENFPVQKRHDPFFLGRDELDPTTEDKVNINSRNENKSFQKSLNTSQLSRRKQYKLNSERNFKRSGFQPKNSTHSFQHKGNKDQRGLNRKERRAIQSRNQEDFYMKGKNDFQFGYQAGFNRKGKNYFQDFGKKIYNEQSIKSNFQIEENSSFRKDRMTNIKGGVISGKALHPSWEAKRKQKELTQTQFQGKKMIFGD